MSDRHNGDLDRRLKGERPEPRDEFVSSLAQRVRTEPTVRRAGWRVAPSLLYDAPTIAELCAAVSSDAPAERCKLMLSTRKIGPVRYCPGGTSTVPPPRSLVAVTAR